MLILFANPTDVASADQAAAAWSDTVVRLTAAVPSGRMFLFTEEQAPRADDGTTFTQLAEAVLTAEPARRPVRTPKPRKGLRRAQRWARTGTASAFGTRPGEGNSGVGWSWEIQRDGPEQRQVQVEVSRGPYRLTDLPAESRNAIRSRGATAVDAFLETEDPPIRIVVSTDGLQPHYADPP